MEITGLRNNNTALQNNNNALQNNNDVLQNNINVLQNNNTAIQQQILGLQIACGVLGALLLFAIILIIIYFAVSSKVKGSNVSYFMFRNNNFFCKIEPP